MKIKKGEKIYYHGDKCNRPGKGEVAEVIDGYVTIKMEDGRSFKVLKGLFSEKYEGHGATKIVKFKAYKEYKKEQIRILEESISN